jgi:hypothetical protein
LIKVSSGNEKQSVAAEDTFTKQICTLFRKVNKLTDVLDLASPCISLLQTVEQIFGASVPLETFGSNAIMKSIAWNGTDHFEIVTSL